MPPYTFTSVTPADFPLLAKWQRTQHVAEWWDDEGPPTAKELKDPRVTRHIVTHQNKPFAYMQDYSPHDWPDHHFAHLPIGSRGIDQYIGDPAMLGRGHGTAFIRSRIAQLFANGAPAIGTDPHPDNQRAIATYQKVGFTLKGSPKQTEWGLILPMTITEPPS